MTTTAASSGTAPRSGRSRVGDGDRGRLAWAGRPLPGSAIGGPRSPSGHGRLPVSAGQVNLVALRRDEHPRSVQRKLPVPQPVLAEHIARGSGIPERTSFHADPVKISVRDCCRTLPAGASHRASTHGNTSPSGEMAARWRALAAQLRRIRLGSTAASDAAQSVRADVGDAHRFQVLAGLLDSLSVDHVDDADPNRDSASHRFGDVGAGTGVAAVAARQMLVSRGGVASQGFRVGWSAASGWRFVTGEIFLFLDTYGQRAWVIGVDDDLATHVELPHGQCPVAGGPPPPGPAAPYSPAGVRPPEQGRHDLLDIHRRSCEGRGSLLLHVYSNQVNPPKAVVS